MNTPLCPGFLLAIVAAALPMSGNLVADPLLSSWFTDYSGKYARIYTNDANKAAGTSVTMWTNGTQMQSAPAYCGVQEIGYDANWVYLKTTGLASHIMGPWLNGAFPNLPKNQYATYRLPRVTDFTSAPATKTLTGLGVIGYFVDGVGMFDSRDAFYWNGTNEGNGSGYWNRDAYVNESPTFDPGYAHQQNTGTHHYHANPIALRYLLGDHVDYNPVTKNYSESVAAATQHSPILGWVNDGSPIYGPYGYATAMNAASGLRRMISGYVRRDGNNGSDSLAATGRTSIPQWAVRLGYSYATSTTGPNISGTYPLGRYLEDNAYLGDLGRTQGVDFDLDEYNGRFCVTPEYPNGVYAYFVSINATGTPVFPYNIGRAFRGSPTGGSTTIPASGVTTYAKTGPNTQEVMDPPGVNPGNGEVTLMWSSVEGGTYKLEASSDLTGSWTALSSSISAATNAVQTSTVETDGATAHSERFYRVMRTALAAYDGGGGGSGTTAEAPGGSANRGDTVTVTITLPTTPPRPPTNIVPASITLETSAAVLIATGTGISRPAQATAQATFAIPAGAPTGLQNIRVVFAAPGPTYFVTFTIN